MIHHVQMHRWAESYAEGGPDARYNDMWSKFIWYGLIGVMVASIGTAGAMLTSMGPFAN